MAKFCAAVMAFAMLVIPASAVASRGPCSKVCVARVKAKKRVEVRREHRRALAREMAGYKRHPMPSCTWAPESSWDPATGASYAGRPWARGRYLVKNPSSTASGKFQILTSTWLANGGGAYASEARWAKPVYQERVARRVARAGISSQWVNC